MAEELISPRPVVTTIQVELSGNRILVRCPNNKELCIRMLKAALRSIEDGQPPQVDAGRGGLRILLPDVKDYGNLLDVYNNGKKKL